MTWKQAWLSIAVELILLRDYNLNAVVHQSDLFSQRQIFAVKCKKACSTLFGISSTTSKDSRITKNIVRNGLLAAAAMNIAGVLLFSKMFSNEVINEADPVVMSNFGLLMIVIWGLAYGGASTIRSNIPWLLAAFAIEKLVYGMNWIHWLSTNSLSNLYEKDLFSGIFFSIYGLNDLFFMLFFSWACFSQYQKSD